MIKLPRTLLPLAALLSGTVLLASCKPTAPLAPATPVVGALKLEPTGAEKNAPGYFPVPLQLSPKKPDGIKSEPKYRAQPKYASFTLGGEGGLTYLVALDEPAIGEWKIYLDANRNGDLTDDGNGAWASKQSQGPQTLYGPNHYVLDVSWKLPDGKGSEGKYGLAFLRPNNAPVLGMFREAARMGTLDVAGKPHKIVLIENDSDALFSKPVATVEEAKKGRPVWLLIDLDDDGKFNVQGGEMVDIRGPFKLAESSYEATVSPDGATVMLAASKKEALDLAPKDESSPMLAEGAVAPDFKVDGPGGETISLSKYRGQVVILDFWSTWCGPCQRSLPHVEKVFQAVKGQPVVVLAVCVFDDRENYDKWLPENKDKYHFQFAFDPAAHEDDKSIAHQLYKTDSIPATYVIDKDGKVAAAIGGFAEGDRRIEDALKKLGVSI